MISDRESVAVLNQFEQQKKSPSKHAVSDSVSAIEKWNSDKILNTSLEELADNFSKVVLETEKENEDAELEQLFDDLSKMGFKPEKEDESAEEQKEETCENDSLVEFYEIYSIQEFNQTHFHCREKTDHPGPAKKRSLVVFDVDHTILTGDYKNSTLVEKEVLDLIQRLAKTPHIDTLGLTARKPHFRLPPAPWDTHDTLAEDVSEIKFRSVAAAFYSGTSPTAIKASSVELSGQEFTSRDLARHNIQFNCRLNIDWKPDQCPVGYQLPTTAHTPSHNVPLLLAQPVFKDNILYTDGNPYKGDALYGFLPSIIHDIDALIIVDDAIVCINSIWEALQDLNQKHGTDVKLVAYHYMRVPLIKELTQLGASADELEEVLSRRKELSGLLERLGLEREPQESFVVRKSKP